MINETNFTENEPIETHENLSKESNLSEHAREILKITRDTEFLQSFLRVNIGADSEVDDSISPRHKGVKKVADEKSVLLPPLQQLQDQQQQQQLQQLEQQEEEQKRQAETAAARQRDKERHRKLRYAESEKEKSAGKTTFSQLTRDLKLRKGPKRGRKRSRIRRQEECYTDKDRAAAVNMGSHDIKQSLKLKRRLDRTRALQIPEEAEPGTLLALGSWEMRSGDINIAISFVHKVLYQKPCAHHEELKDHLAFGKVEYDFPQNNPLMRAASSSSFSRSILSFAKNLDQTQGRISHYLIFVCNSLCFFATVCKRTAE